MTWYAIKGPDGEIVGPAMQNKDRAWDYATQTCGELRRLSERISGLRVVYVKTWRLKAARLGYRCVEVQLVEPGTADKLAKIIEWAKENVPDKCTCSPEYYNRGRQDPSCLWCDFEAEQLWEIIVDSTAPTGGAESKEG